MTKIKIKTIRKIVATISTTAILITSFAVYLEALQFYAAKSIVTNYVVIERKASKANKPSVEVVRAEIIKQAEIFGINKQFALDLADCESKFDAWAKNPNSTARGVYQYLIATWEKTESAKQGKERNDHKANIREAMIDIANGEAQQKWSECL